MLRKIQNNEHHFVWEQHIFCFIPSDFSWEALKPTVRDHTVYIIFSSHTFSALNRSDCFVDSTSADAPFSKMSCKSRELKWIIRSSLSAKKQQNKKELFYWLWWLWANVLLNREALWAASCPSPVWGAPSTRRRPVEKRHLVHPPRWARRFQPGATKHPETGNTPSVSPFFEVQPTYVLFSLS